jgi:hypothetical protein
VRGTAMRALHRVPGEHRSIEGGGLHRHSRADGFAGRRARNRDRTHRSSLTGNANCRHVDRVPQPASAIVSKPSYDPPIVVERGDGAPGPVELPPLTFSPEPRRLDRLRTVKVGANIPTDAFAMPAFQSRPETLRTTIKAPWATLPECVSPPPYRRRDVAPAVLLSPTRLRQ